MNTLLTWSLPLIMANDNAECPLHRRLVPAWCSTRSRTIWLASWKQQHLDTGKAVF